MMEFKSAILGAIIGWLIGLIITCYIQHKRNKAYKQELLLMLLKRK